MWKAGSGFQVLTMDTFCTGSSLAAYINTFGESPPNLLYIPDPTGKSVSTEGKDDYRCYEYGNRVVESVRTAGWVISPPFLIQIPTVC